MKNKIKAVPTLFLGLCCFSLSTSSSFALEPIRFDDLAPNLQAELSEIDNNFGTGDKNIVYELKKDENNNLIFEDITGTSPTEGSYTIQFNYPSSETVRVIVAQTDVIDKIEGTYYNIPSVWSGGALVNLGEIDTISGDFVQNYVPNTGGNRGGAIYNNPDKIINHIRGNFIGNYIIGGKGHGGAIGNDGIIQDIEGNFISNYVNSSTGQAYGGAILNYGAINSINGLFVGNYIDTVGSSRYLVAGGAIYNGSLNTMDKIQGTFINNYINTQLSQAAGGVLHNSFSSVVNLIQGNFVGNYVFSKTTLAAGGVIANKDDAIINLIQGTFSDNYAASQDYGGQGGAINNNGTNSYIKEINATFINNHATGLKSAFGGAIVNRSTIDKINSDFIGNYTHVVDNYTRGGAILNSSPPDSIIKEINGNFIKNSVKSDNGGGYGGAISNGGEIDTINGNFEENQAITTGTGNTAGGALFNNGTINSIYGTFIKNSTIANTNQTIGGAIAFSGGTTNLIQGNFNENNIYTLSGIASGGAIGINNSTVNTIEGIFTKNSAISEDNLARGGAIMSNKPFEIINSTFRDNFAQSGTNSALGGAIMALNTDITIKADNGTTLFSGNYTKSSDVIEENAIYINNGSLNLISNNNGSIIFDDTIDGENSYSISIDGDILSNVEFNNLVKNASITLDNTRLHLGVTDEENNTSNVLATSDIQINSGMVDTIDNKYTNYNIQNLTSNNGGKFNIDLDLSKEIQNSDTFTVGENSTGKITLSSFNVIPSKNDSTYIIQVIKAQNDNIQLDFDPNKVINQIGANATSDTIIAESFDLYTTNTRNDSIIVKGMKDTFAEWSNFDTVEDKTFTFVDSSTKFLSEDLSELKGNNITINGVNTTINANNKEFLHKITSEQKISLNNISLINGKEIDNKGEIALNNVNLTSDIVNDNLISASGTTKFEGEIQNNANLNIENAKATFNNSIMGNGNIAIVDSSVNLNNKVQNQNIEITNSDVVVSNSKDFINNSLEINSGNFNVQNLELNNLYLNNLSLTDGTINIISTDADLQNSRMGNIQANSYGINPRGKINVNNINLLSDAKENLTSIKFADYEIQNNIENNVEEITGPIYKYNVSYNTTDEGGYFNFSKGANGSGNTYQAFNPAVFSGAVSSQIGGFLAQSEIQQQGFFFLDKNMKYTKAQRLAMKKENHYAISEGSALYIPKESYKIIPYTTFEKVNLRGGVSVDSISYGTLVGSDSEIYKLKKGFKGVFSPFIGYNGSHQNYDGISTYQNGGFIGATGTLFKNNFFTALTTSAGASTGSASTSFGSDNFTMLTAGIASKTGYNFEFQEGKFILQPSLYLGYSFVNTFDYTTSQNVKIKSDPLHAIQIIPAITFISNTKNGWQPYATVNMVFNAMDKSKFSANDINLPNLSVKPYVQYGVGIQKKWKDRFTAFGQAIVRNGGRNGVSLMFGMNFALGKDYSKKKNTNL